MEPPGHQMSDPKGAKFLHWLREDVPDWKCWDRRWSDQWVISPQAFHPTAVQVVSRMSSINSIIHFCKDSQTLPGWWLNQPLWKICASQHGLIFPNFRSENSKDVWNHQPAHDPKWVKWAIDPITIDQSTSNGTSKYKIKLGGHSTFRCTRYL